jgi:hypothetical protein
MVVECHRLGRGTAPRNHVQGDETIKSDEVMIYLTSNKEVYVQYKWRGRNLTKVLHHMI